MSKTAEPPAPGRAIATAAAIGFNILPLIGVLIWGWSAFALIFLYWIENLVIGAFNVARILVTGAGHGGAGILGSVFFAGFFTLHYGLFCLVHGAFVIALFGGGPGEGMFDLAGAAQRVFAATPALIWGLVSIVALQIVGFALFVVRGKYRTANIMTLMGEPYGRIIALHLAIIFGGFLIMALDAPQWAVAVLVLVKTLIDVHAARGAAPLFNLARAREQPLL